MLDCSYFDFYTSTTINIFISQFPVPEKFSAQDLSTVVCFDTETTPTLLIEVMVGNQTPFELIAAIEYMQN